MVSKIRVLSDQTINQIAAGEVIENPASVVKELIDNSIDAGATDICVEIKSGGRQLIRITDNGCGMSEDDALLCLERHATSKIRDIDDINTLFTMGFRGEAIPSIASISKFSLITCANKTEMGTISGTMVLVEGGRILKCCPAARSQGTTIEVNSLFFNIPVRKKFQKSPTHDANEILKIITFASMGYPHIKFELISDQKSILATPHSQSPEFLAQLAERIPAVMGKEFFHALHPLEDLQDEFSLQGYIGNPNFNRHNRTGQHLFINRRAVTSPLVSFAVRDGYGTTLGANRYPVFVLHLTIPGELVDVNVHPQKREVRLRQEQQLKEQIIRAVEKALCGCRPSVSFDTSLPTPMSCWEFPVQYVEEVEEIRTSTSNPFMVEKPAMDEERMTPTWSTVFASAPKPLFNKAEAEAAANIQPTLFTYDTSHAPIASVQVLAAIPKYILIDPSTIESTAKEGLCIVDQRAAHSRIIFEKLLEKKAATLDVQTLLIPYIFEVSPIESILIEEHLDALNQLGIRIHQSTADTFLIDAIPSIFGNADLKQLIDGILYCLQDEGQRLDQEKVKRIALAASRSAISQKQRLSFDEAQALVRQLFACQSPFQCPVGRPTLIHITPDELAKKFFK